MTAKSVVVSTPGNRSTAIQNSDGVTLNTDGIYSSQFTTNSPSRLLFIYIVCVRLTSLYSRKFGTCRTLVNNDRPNG